MCICPEFLGGKDGELSKTNTTGNKNYDGTDMLAYGFLQVLHQQEAVNDTKREKVLNLMILQFGRRTEFFFKYLSIEWYECLREKYLAVYPKLYYQIFKHLDLKKSHLVYDFNSITFRLQRLSTAFRIYHLYCDICERLCKLLAWKIVPATYFWTMARNWSTTQLVLHAQGNVVFMFFR